MAFVLMNICTPKWGDITPRPGNLIILAITSFIRFKTTNLDLVRQAAETATTSRSTRHEFCRLDSLGGSSVINLYHFNHRHWLCESEMALTRRAWRNDTVFSLQQPIPAAITIISSWSESVTRQLWHNYSVVCICGSRDDFRLRIRLPRKEICAAYIQLSMDYAGVDVQQVCLTYSSALWRKLTCQHHGVALTVGSESERDWNHEAIAPQLK